MTEYILFAFGQGWVPISMLYSQFTLWVIWNQKIGVGDIVFERDKQLLLSLGIVHGTSVWGE